MSARAARHALEYALFTVVAWKVRFLPEGLALRTGAALGRLLGLMGVRRDVVDANLSIAFPDEPPEWRRRVADAGYAHLGREAAAVIRMSWMTPAEIIARTTIEGFDAFQEALAEGRGVILSTGHLGSWEVGAACLAARGVPVVGVTKPMANPRFGRSLDAMRARLGYRVLHVDGARRIVGSLARGEMVALLGDQRKKGGVSVPFFGRPAATAKGAARLALKTGAPLFLGVAVHEAGEPHRYRGILERIPLTPTGDAQEDIRRITAAHTAALERLVRRYPEQYFWQHRRWEGGA